MARSRPVFRRIAPGYAAVRDWLSESASESSRFVCLSPDQGPAVQPLLEDVGCEIIELGPLVLQVARILRQEHGMIASARATLAAIETVTRDLPDDHPFAPSRRFAGFHRALAATLRDLRHGGFEPEDLIELSWQLSAANPEVLRAVGEVWIAVRDRLSAIHRQFSTDVMRRQIGEPLPTVEPLGHLLVWWVHRDPLVAKWLDWLAGQGVPVTIVAEGFDRDSKGFAEANWIETCYEAHAPSPEHWTQALFTSAPAQNVPRMGECTAYDRMSEVEWCIRSVFDEMSQGVRPDQIGIYVREPGSYLPLLEHVALAYSLPLEVNLRVPLIQNAFCRFVLEILDTLAGDDIRRLQVIINSSYLGFEPDTAVRLNAIVLASVERETSSWDRLAKALGEIAEEGTHLIELLRWRAEALGDSRPLADWLEMLRRLLAIEPIPTRAMSPQNPTFERDLRATNAMQRSLTDLASVEGLDSTVTFTGFVQRCRREWAEVEVTLPKRQDGGVKVVTSVGQLRDFSALFVLEAAEGILPRRRREDPILRDDARHALNVAFPQCGPLLDSHDDARRERDDFIRVCAAGRTRLQFSLPRTRDEQDVSPSFYLNELGRLAGDAYEDTDRGSGQVLPLLADCRLPRDAAMRRALDGRALEAVPPVALVTVEAKEAARPNFSEGLTARQVALAYACGFRAGWDELNAKPSRTLEALATLSRLPLSANLARQPDLETGARALRAEVQKFLAAKFAELPFPEWRRVEATAHRAERAWLASERTIRDALGVDPSGVKLHVEMGQEGTRSGIKTESGTVKFRDPVPVLMQVGPYTVLREYRRSIPDLRPGDMQDHLAWGLRLAMVAKGSRALLIETPEGKIGIRTLREESDRPLQLRATTPRHRISSASITEAPTSTYLRELVQATNVAMKRLEEADMIARPGPHCETCPYGEVCRSSALHLELPGDKP